jgi:hypothetical protein
LGVADFCSAHIANSTCRLGAKSQYFTVLCAELATHPAFMQGWILQSDLLNFSVVKEITTGILQGRL